MKKRLAAILYVVFLNLLPCLAFASDVQKRIAFIVDTKDVASEVRGLQVEPGNRNIWGNIFADNDNTVNTIIVDTNPFYLGIPLNIVISAELKGESCSVKYHLKAQDRTIVGKLVNFGKFSGKTDFGDFALSMDKLKELTFKGTPSPTVSKSKKSLSYNTILVLTDGKQVPVANFKRFNTYCSSAGYIIGCGDRYEYKEDFRFLRGESLQTVLFKEIKTIEFNNIKSFGPGTHLQGNVTVTLKNGKSSMGELTQSVDGADVDGYTGIYQYDNGEFFFYLDAGFVKSIVFGVEPK